MISARDVRKIAKKQEKSKRKEKRLKISEEKKICKEFFQEVESKIVEASSNNQKNVSCIIPKDIVLLEEFDIKEYLVKKGFRVCTYRNDSQQWIISISWPERKTTSNICFEKVLILFYIILFCVSCLIGIIMSYYFLIW